jgi:hypothetical protein
MKKLKQPTKAGPVPKTEKNNQNSKAVREKNEGFPGYPLYPSADDIYNRGKKMDLNPEGMSETKDPVEKLRKNNDVVPDGDLDVPGAELDDKQENVGSEDEENNYYSLGGDGHTDLDEDTAGS